VSNPTEEQQTISTVPTNGTQEEEVPERPQRKSTPYERLSFDLSNDQRCLKEITLGKRIGFYRIRGELGTGNFSQVKMGIHALVKGNDKQFLQRGSFIRKEV
jgi:serine/threonine-protein kinase NIM1